MSQNSNSSPDLEAIRGAAVAPEQITERKALAQFASSALHDAGEELHVVGHILGTDRRDGESPFGHGDDTTVAISMLLRISAQLISASADLISDGRHYAGAALVRQLVEVEYFAWAFETKDEEAARWLRSTHEERREFFTPAKLRAAAGTRFRSKDYGHHCELGGHPVPTSWRLLNGEMDVAQMILSDCLGHSGRIWDHLVGWARQHPNGGPIMSRAEKMSERFAHWRQVDFLTALPAPL